MKLKVSNLLQSATSVSLWTLFSRVLGYVRDVVLTRHFGSSIFLDIYLAVAVVPGLLRSLILEGPLLRVFLPGLVRSIETDGAEAGRIYTARTLSAVYLIAVSLAALVAVFAPQVIQITAPGYAANPSENEFAVGLLRILAIYIVIAGVNSILTGALHRLEKFGVATAVQCSYNLCIIAAVLLYATYDPEPHLERIAWFVVLSGLIQAAVLLWWLGPQHIAWMKMRFTDWRHPDMKLLYASLTPALAVTGIDALTTVVNNAVLSTQETGSVTWIYAAHRLIHLPMALVGFALGAVLFPMIVKAVQSKTEASVRRPLRVAFNTTLALSFVAGVLFMTLPHQVIALLFERGNWGAFDTGRSAQALLLMSPAVAGYMLNALLIVVFYARNELSVLVRIYVISLIAKLLIIGVFVLLLDRGHLAVAIAESVSVLLRVTLMLIVLLRWRLLRPSELFRDASSQFIVFVGIVVGAALVAPELAWFKEQGVLFKLAIIGGTGGTALVLHLVLLRLVSGMNLAYMLLTIGSQQEKATTSNDN